MQTVELSWSDFKQVIDNQLLNYQYFDFNNTYHIYTCNGPVTILCKIYKDNSLDQEDFDDNYKLSGNKPLKQKVVSEPADLSVTRYVASDAVTVEHGQEVTIDLELEQDDDEAQQILYGGALYTENSGFEDYVRFQVIDINNVLGYGTNVVLKEYIKKAYLNNNGVFEDYDEAGAYLPAGLFLRCIYKSEKDTGNTKIKINYLIGIPS